MTLKSKPPEGSRPVSALGPWLRSLWSFSRPHTIIGTSLSVVGLAVMALALTPSLPAWTPALSEGPPWTLNVMLLAIGSALIPSLCANVYIVGLNQLTDIDIDRINKPQLPLASGQFSPREGRWIVLILGGLALLMAMVQGPILLGTVLLSMVIGTVYSLPPFRLKRFPFWAALCIFGVRGLVINLGFFVHFRQQIQSASAPWDWSPDLPPELWALTLFVVLFALAIALFKDIPDAEGDRQFQIRTLTVRLGPEFVFGLSRWVLTLSYGLLVGLTLGGLLPSVQTLFLVVVHLGLLGIMWGMSFQVDLRERSQISRFYQLVWRLFFFEYILFPLACVMG
ncbi:homogentisate phytyltransferase [Lyngbya confervoides]|uniref:Homogentisate phytyltransferase n=1 Tax=Lyngbya confervoides BDU141951 TaxID=1574623 RepID=A0ABD4T9E3_9CYAN|nr:homogentisate phytyltransferase [Lyngbya confervoides]MCM1985069.1 homogentisate phytyltransferase [Lyngbya confervoides BDU141951]